MKQLCVIFAHQAHISQVSTRGVLSDGLTRQGNDRTWVRQKKEHHLMWFEVYVGAYTLWTEVASLWFLR